MLAREALFEDVFGYLRWGETEHMQLPFSKAKAFRSAQFGDTPATLSWDANGNLISDGATTFGYDTENRLTSASGAKNASLSYDPLGRLYEVTTPSAVTWIVYDGDRLVAEYNGSGALLRRYVHGAGIDEPLVRYEGASVAAANRRYLHANHQGSIVALTDTSGKHAPGECVRCLRRHRRGWKNVLLAKHVHQTPPIAGPPVATWNGRRHGRRADRRWAKAWSPEQIARRLPL